MVFPSPDNYKGKSLENVEPVGVFRCPHCAEIEKENERLRERIEHLETLLELEITDDDEI